MMYISLIYFLTSYLYYINVLRIKWDMYRFITKNLFAFINLIVHLREV